MSRIPIDRIGEPPAEYHIETGRNLGLIGFESETAACAEDQKRIKGLRAQARRDRTQRREIRRLVARIERTADRRCRSLASFTYMRDLRQRVIGNLWALVANVPELDWRTVALFSRGWEVPAGQLHTFDPRVRLSAVRSLINRCGGTEAGGYLIGFIHGEFEPNRQVYQLHLHLLVAGGLLRVLDERVRKTPTCRSIRSCYGRTEFVYQRLRIDPPPTNLPCPLTYLLKGYWPSRWQGRNLDGKLIRQRVGSRIAEPHHTELLLWLDQWRLTDLTLLINLSVDRTGFRLADRAYTNGDNQ